MTGSMERSHPARGRTEDAMMDTTAGWRARSWAAAMAAGALAAVGTLFVVLGGAAGAEESRYVDLDIRKTVHPKTVQVGEPQTFTVKITNDGTTRAYASFDNTLDRTSGVSEVSDAATAVAKAQGD